MPMTTAQEFNDFAVNPPIRGFLHQPSQPNGDALVLTHGAGASCSSKLLTALAEAFADAGFLVLRCDLPFRQARPFGPPFPALAARDREGLLRAVEIVKQKVTRRVFLGGHSYGGRQGSMLTAERPDLVAGLLLLSYPLHPPRKPAELRTAHFSQLKTPALFVHGGRDPFGSHEELRSALELLPGKHMLMEVDGAGHELLGKKKDEDLPVKIVQVFQEFIAFSS